MASAPEVPEVSPDAATLAGFGAVVLIGGFNFVGVRFSNQELPPFFGASMRFAAAAVLLIGIVAVARIAMPKGRSLTGALIFGVLSFGAAYALAYWALQNLPAGIAGVVMASVPLLTFLFAFVHRVEPLRLRGLLGALIVVAGIGILLNAPAGGGGVHTLSLLAMVGAAAAAAESTVILKQFPPAHPLATNAVAMSTGTVLLMLLSRIAGERWLIPMRTETWTALGYLIIVGSVGMFTLYLFVLRKWTASGVSYQFVLAPIVAVLAGAWLAGERVTGGIAAGGAVVLVGVYVGALSHHRKVAIPASSDHEAVCQRCPS